VSSADYKESEDPAKWVMSGRWIGLRVGLSWSWQLKADWTLAESLWNSDSAPGFKRS
jgi:hypothetical protein